MFEDRQRTPTGLTGAQRTPDFSSPAVQTRAFPPLIFTPQLQRQVQVGQQLAAQTLRPVALQRQQISPVFEASGLQREVDEGLRLQRQSLQAQVSQSRVSNRAIEDALERQTARYAPVPGLQHAPARPAEWVQAARLEVQRVADPAAPEQTRWLNGAERERHVGSLRSVGHGLAQGFNADRGPAVQRYAEYGEHLATLQRQPLTGSIPRMVLAQVSPAERPLLQRAVDEALQRQAEQDAQDQAALHQHALQRQLAELDHQAEQPILERIQARRGGGSPLPVLVQRQLEARLNHDLSGVRVHTDAEADLLSKKVNAVAFTTGQDIYFQSGRFDPNSKTGIELLAHEATHTVQQSRGQVGKGIDPDAGLEGEARSFGARFASNLDQKAVPQQKALPVNPYAPGSYSQPAALERVKAGAVQAAIHHPFAALQRQSEAAIQRFDLNPLHAIEKGADWAADKAKGAIASGLSVIPGYRELCLTFGKDLVTGKAMAQNPNAILDALSNWVPGPLKDVLQALRETNAIPKAWAWFQGELSKLNLEGLPGEIGQAIKSASLDRAKQAVMGRVGGLKALIVGSARKIADIGLTALAAGLGPLGQQVVARLRSSGDLIIQVLKNPARFAGNLLNALKSGFRNFAGHAPQHLQNGLGEWLTGSSGISFPARLDLPGVFMTVLTVMGLSYQHLRAKLVEKLGAGGAKRVQQAEQTVGALQSIRGGLQHADEMKSGQGSVSTEVVRGVKAEVTQGLVVAGITKVASMLIPGGGFVQALIGAFRSVQFVIQQGQQIMGVITSALGSVSAIAAGNITGAAGLVETTLARSIPVALGFLSKIIGLGNIGGRIKGIIERLRGKLDGLIDRVVARIGKLIERILPAAKPGRGPQSTAQPTADAAKAKGHDEKVAKGLADIPRIERSFAKMGVLENQAAAKNVARAVKGRHRIFKAVTPRFEKNTVVYDWVASQGSQNGTVQVATLTINVESIRKEFWKKAGRPGWSAATKRTMAKQYPGRHVQVAGVTLTILKSGFDRRHIMAFDQTVTSVASQLNHMTFDDARTLLASKNFAPSGATEASIKAALKRFLTAEFNQVQNLFVDDAAENQQKGREMEQAEQRRGAALRAGNQPAAAHETQQIATHATDVPRGQAGGQPLRGAQQVGIATLRRFAASDYAALEGHMVDVKAGRSSAALQNLWADAQIDMKTVRLDISRLARFSKRGDQASNTQVTAAMEHATAQLRILADLVRG